MRAGGAAVGVGELLAAHRALAAVDSASPRATRYFALRAALCSRAPTSRCSPRRSRSSSPSRSDAHDPLEQLGRHRALGAAAHRHPDRDRADAADRARATRRSRPPAARRSCCARRTSPSTPTTSARWPGRCSRGSPAAAPQRVSRRTRPTRRRRDVPRPARHGARVAAPRRRAARAALPRARRASAAAGAGRATSPARWRRTRACCCSTCRRASPPARGSRRSCSARG